MEVNLLPTTGHSIFWTTSEMNVLLDLDESCKSARWALSLQNCKAFLQASNLCIALSLALLIRDHTTLTLWLKLGNILFNCSLLLVHHFQIFTAVFEADFERLDLRLCALDLSLF